MSALAFYMRTARTGPQTVLGWLLYVVLVPFGLLYGRVLWFRALLYKRGVMASYRSSLPVVSVGNLTVGGTGKTPMVDHLVRWFVARGIKPAVVSRGYGAAAGKSPRLISAGDGRLLLSAEEGGDEPVLIATRNPQAVVIVARERRRGVRQAEAQGAQVVILDDGYQHLAVARNLDLLLLDSRNLFGNGLPLPAGLLREPVSAGRRADLLVLTHAASGEIRTPGMSQQRIFCRHVLAESVVSPQGERITLNTLRKKSVAAFAGIADPSAFFQALQTLGLDLIAKIALADHQVYTRQVLAELERATQGAELLLTTEKDAVKLRGLTLSRPSYAVPMTLEFDDHAPLERALEALFTKE